MFDFILRNDQVVLAEEYENDWISDMVSFDKGWNVFFPLRGAGIPDEISNEVLPVEVQQQAQTEINQETAFVDRLDREGININVNLNYG